MAELLNTRTVQVKVYVCQRCTYEWQPRHLGHVPVKCPRCRNANWDKPYRRLGLAKWPDRIKEDK